MMDTGGIIQKLMREISTHRKELKRVEEAFKRYQSIFDNIPVGVYRSTPDGRIIKANKAMARIFGYDSPEELMAAGSYALYPDPGVRDEVKEEARKKDINEFELRMKRKDGKLIWIRGTERVVKDEKGEVLFYDGFLEDITEQKMAEEEARQLERLFKDLTEKSLVGIYLIQDGVFKYVNPRLAEIFGYSVEEIVDKLGPSDLTYPEDRHIVKENIRKRIEGKVKSIHYVFRGLRKDGKFIWVKAYGSLTIYEGRPAIIGTLVDITEETERDKKLRESEELYRAIVENSHDGIYIYRGNKFLFVNKKIKEITEYAEDELYKMNIFDLIHPDDRKRIREYARKRAEGKEVPSTYSAKIVTKNGRIKIVEFAVTRINFKGEYAAVGFVRDVTWREKLSKELKEEKERAEKYLNIAGSIIVVLDREGRVKLINLEGSRLLGLPKEEIIGKNWFEYFIPEENREEMMGFFNRIVKGEEKGEHYVNPILTAKGDLKIVKWRNSVIRDDEGKVIEVLSAGIDITELLEKEEKLQASLREKEVLLRELHHRVKNNLQIITSLLRLHSRYVKSPEVLNILKDSQSRIKSIALLHEKFYHSEDLANVKFGDYIKSLVRDLYRSYDVDRSRVELKLEVDNIFLPIDRAIPAGLVINELVSNSLKYAFPEGRKGTIRIKLSLKGEEVEIIVSDDGVGISKDVDFDSPSTFGFRLIRILVEEQLKGKIKLKTGKGTEFRIRFRR